MKADNQQSTTRRTVLSGAAVAVLGPAGTACSGSGGAETSPVPTAPVDLGAVSAVPVGGTKLFPEQRLVVSQPAEGEFTAFGAVCTHNGCVLDTVERREGNCPCHGSRFDVTTGEVLKGPAGEPLPEVPVRVRSGRLIAGPPPK